MVVKLFEDLLVLEEFFRLPLVSLFWESVRVESFREDPCLQKSVKNVFDIFGKDFKNWSKTRKSKGIITSQILVQFSNKMHL